MTSSEFVKLTAMHHRHIALGAKIVSEDGWLRPEKYTSIEEEEDAARRNVAIYDISNLLKIDLKGKDIGKLRTISNKSLEIGHVSDFTIGKKGILGENSWWKLTNDNVLITSSLQDKDGLISMLIQKSINCVHITDVSSGYAGISIIGPRSRDVLSKLTELEISSKGFHDHSCASTRLAGVHAIIGRIDVNNILSFVVLVSREYGEFIWNIIMNAGQEFYIKPIGIASYRKLKEEVKID